MKSIADDAFPEPTKVVKVLSIPTKMTRQLAEQVLIDENWKKVLLIPEGVQELGGECFRDLSIHEVRVPESVTSRAENAFEACRDLRQITFAGASQAGLLGSGVFKLFPNLKIV